MTNHVLCFDSNRHLPGQRAASNAETLFSMLNESDEQMTWYHCGTRSAERGNRLSALRWREHALSQARAAIAEAYEYLVDWWQPGDHIFVFGAGRGGFCAQALTRLLGTVGVLPDLMDYVLDAYAVPRTPRTTQDWQRVTHVASRLAGSREFGTPVWFLGLWDSCRVPGARRSTPAQNDNVVYGRHAVAIDGVFGERLTSSTHGAVEEVWFRGAHCDVAGGPGACRPLADIAFDWMLDGAVKAGLEIAASHRYSAPAPSELDALAGSAKTVSIRSLPPDAVVHSSVDVYLQEHPEYWRRLPAHVIWADRHWVDRGERLVRTEASAPEPIAPAVLTAVAS
jgi:uncharacterized protein (DUF2235 family)